MSTKKSPKATSRTGMKVIKKVSREIREATKTAKRAPARRK